MTRAVIRVELPYHLQTLARVGAQVSVEVEAPVTIGHVLDQVEARYPMLCGTIRDHVTKKRRPMVRFFGCESDLSHDPPHTLLPLDIVSGREPLIIWGRAVGRLVAMLHSSCTSVFGVSGPALTRHGSHRCD